MPNRNRWQDSIRHARDLLGEMPVWRMKKKGAGRCRGRLQTTLQVWHMWKKRGKGGFGRKDARLQHNVRRSLRGHWGAPKQTLPLNRILLWAGVGKCGLCANMVVDLKVGQLGLSFSCAPHSTFSRRKSKSAQHTCMLDMLGLSLFHPYSHNVVLWRPHP